MLITEERFVGAYLCALEEALTQTRVKAVIDAEIAVLSDWFKSIIQGGLVEKKKTRSLIELPIIFSLRFQRDPEKRTRFIRHLFLDCSRQEKRDAHDRAILRSAYLSCLLEGMEGKEAQEFVLRHYKTGFLFTSYIDELAKDGLFFPLPGDEKSMLPHVPTEARMFSAACFGARFGPQKVQFADWQEKLIENKLSVKILGSMLFKAAYGYLG